LTTNQRYRDTVRTRSSASVGTSKWSRLVTCFRPHVCDLQVASSVAHSYVVIRPRYSAIICSREFHAVSEPYFRSPRRPCIGTTGWDANVQGQWSGEVIPSVSLLVSGLALNLALMAAQAVNVRRVAVIGAGVSGVAAAIHLRRAGLEVIVYERSRRAGGIW